MANYYATARSNYFRVNNEEAFTAWAEKTPIGFWKRGLDRTDMTEQENYFAVFAPDGEGWPAWYDDEHDVCHDFDVTSEIIQFLHADDVAVFMEVGAEKMRYVVGCAVAVNAKGERVTVTLDDIYKIVAEELLGECTDATY